MYGRIKAIAAAIALIPLIAACGSSSTPTTPTNPITETFTGTITQNSATTVTFSTTTSGTVIATLTSLTPLATVQIGFALGTWDGTACQVVLVNPTGTTGSQLQASASTKGNYCVHLYDTGNIAADTPVAYTLTVVHP
jgi:hypothetical protein